MNNSENYQQYGNQPEPVIVYLKDQLKRLLSPYGALSKDIISPITYSQKEINSKSTTSTTSLNLRKKYNDVSVLYKLILYCLSHQSDNSTQVEVKKIKSELSETLSYLEIEKYITIVPFADTDSEASSITFNRLLDIGNDFSQEKAKLSLSSQHFSLLKEMIEDYLNMTCLDIFGFTFPGVLNKSQDDGILCVVEHVQRLKSDNSTKKDLVIQQQEYNSSLLSMVFNQLSEYGKALESLILKYRFSEHPVLYLKYKTISMRTYLLKLRHMELEILCNTYSEKSIPALKQLNKKIEHNQRNTQNKLLYIEHKLSAYEGLDPKFKDLLKEFSTLQKDIKLFQSDFKNT